MRNTIDDEFYDCPSLASLFQTIEELNSLKERCNILDSDFEFDDDFDPFEEEPEEAQNTDGCDCGNVCMDCLGLSEDDF